ncbi:uncharacterized protein [Montipora capricornis]|uniref:uncharacterized protein isoform X1 n=1 Tax=Montipora capricornis TaxID=246305 RepID=UPI0035F1E03C
MLSWLKSILMLFFFQFSTRRNITLVFKNIWLQLLIQWRKICYFLRKRVGLPLCRQVFGKDVPASPLSLFLYNIGKWHDTVWQERKRFLSPYIAFEEKIIGDVYGMGEVRVKYTGSFRVGLQSLGMSGSDNDMMYIYKSILVDTPQKATTNAHLIIQTSEYPGHVYLKLNVSNSVFTQLYHKIALNVRADNFGFPAAEEIKKILLESGVQSLQPEGSNEYFLSSEVFTELHSRFNYFRFGGWLTFRQSGPASTIRWNISTLPNYVNFGTLDNVFALHCPSWPAEARAWVKRKRKYSCQKPNVVEAILNYGVDLVPKPKKVGCDSLTNSTRTKFLWRLSFSIPELLLINSWNDVQRICYRYGKTLLKTNLSHLGIPSYCGLNVMFWIIEETESGQWIDLHLVHCLKMFFEKLERCCQEGFCSHYFVPENNLFWEIPKDKLLKGSRICRAIRKELYTYLWLDEGIWCYLNGYSQTNWMAFNTTSVFYKITDEQILMDFLNKCSKAVSDLKLLCERNFRIYYCLKVYRELAVVWHASEQYHDRKEFVLKAVRTFLQDSTHGAQSTEEKLIANSVRFANLRFLKAYLQQVASNSECSTFHFKELVQLQRDISCQSDVQGSVVVALEYYLDGNFEAAAKMLENTSFPEESDEITGSFPVFSALERNCVDQHIRAFSFKGNAYYCPEIVVRWYVLWQCYLALGRAAEHVASARRKLKELDLNKLYQENLRIMKPLFEPFGRYLQNMAIREHAR